MTWSSRRARGSGSSIKGLDREGAAGAFDDRGIGEQAGDAGAVDGGGHDEDAQVGAKRGGVEGQGEAEVAIEAAFVEFVEEHGGDAGQLGIVQQHAGEDAFGDDFDAGAGGDLCCPCGRGSRRSGPTSSPRVWAMRWAAARAARRRGSSMMMRRSPRQGASSRARGTRVVLPAPGGATRTA